MTAATTHSNTEQVFTSRVSRLREGMQKARLSALIVYKFMGEYWPYGGIGYARYIVPWTSPPIPPAIVLVPREGDVYCLLMDGLGADHLDAPIPGLVVRKDAAMAGMYRNEALELVRVLADVDKSTNFTAGTVGLAIPNELPAWLNRAFGHYLPSMSAVDATDLLNDAMMVKSTEEIGAVTRAAELADAAFQTIFDSIAIGQRELEVSAAAHCAVLQGGASYADIRVSSGRPGSVQHGVRPSTQKMIQSGDHVHLGVDINFNGYWSNVVKRGVMGRATESHQALFQVALDMQAAAISALQPGTRASQAAKASIAVLDNARSRGLIRDVNVQRLGHGIGLENQEPPLLIADEERLVQPGMTFAVHAGFSVPGGPQVANGDMVLVTKEGPRRLTSFPGKLVEIAR